MLENYVISLCLFEGRSKIHAAQVLRLLVFETVKTTENCT